MSIKEIETKTRELMELRRMREELDAEIETLTDGIKAAMGDAESLTAGAYRLKSRHQFPAGHRSHQEGTSRRGRTLHPDQHREALHRSIKPQCADH